MLSMRAFHAGGTTDLCERRTSLRPRTDDAEPSARASTARSPRGRHGCAKSRTTTVYSAPCVPRQCPLLALACVGPMRAWPSSGRERPCTQVCVCVCAQRCGSLSACAQRCGSIVAAFCACHVRCSGSPARGRARVEPASGTVPSAVQTAVSSCAGPSLDCGRDCGLCGAPDGLSGPYEAVYALQGLIRPHKAF